MKTNHLYTNRKLIPKSIGKGSRRWPGRVVRKAKGGKKK